MSLPIDRSLTVPQPWPLAAAVLALSLAAFGMAWEWFLDPLRPGGSWMMLKVLPLGLALPGLVRGRMQTFRWMSLLVWLYVGEALVRVMGITSSERALGGISLVLSMLLAIAVLGGARSQINLLKARLRSQGTPTDQASKPSR